MSMVSLCVFLSQAGCSAESAVAGGAVCGMNGETYRSECEAWSLGGVPVDYLGPCRLLAFDYGPYIPPPPPPTLR